MRHIAAAALLMAAIAATHAAEPSPTYQEKFDQYVRLGWAPEEIVAGLTRWFGKSFDLEFYHGEVYVRLVQRRPDLSIYRLETIGKMQQ